MLNNAGFTKRFVATWRFPAAKVPKLSPTHPFKQLIFDSLLPLNSSSFSHEKQFFIISLSLSFFSNLYPHIPTPAPRPLRKTTDSSQDPLFLMAEVRIVNKEKFTLVFLNHTFLQK